MPEALLGSRTVVMRRGTCDPKHLRDPRERSARRIVLAGIPGGGLVKPRSSSCLGHQKPEEFYGQGANLNRSRVDYAKAAIAEMMEEAIREHRSGTIGVEVAVKDGRLGRVKRLMVDFQAE